jgi:hypothetical protein
MPTPKINIIVRNIGGKTSTFQIEPDTTVRKFTQVVIKKLGIFLIPDE